MKRAVIFNDGNSFSGIALDDTQVYDENVIRDRSFIYPIIVPNGLTPNEVLQVLNDGKKRLLKTTVGIKIGEKTIEHYKLSKS